MEVILWKRPRKSLEQRRIEEIANHKNVYTKKSLKQQQKKFPCFKFGKYINEDLKSTDTSEFEHDVITFNVSKISSSDKSKKCRRGRQPRSTSLVKKGDDSNSKTGTNKSEVCMSEQIEVTKYDEYSEDTEHIKSCCVDMINIPDWWENIQSFKGEAEKRGGASLALTIMI